MADPLDRFVIGHTPDPELLLRCTGAPLCQAWTTLPYGAALASPNALRRALFAKNWAAGNGRGDNGLDVVSPLCPACADRILQRGTAPNVDARGGTAEAPSSLEREVIKSN